MNFKFQSIGLRSELFKRQRVRSNHVPQRIDEQI